MSFDPVVWGSLRRELRRRGCDVGELIFLSKTDDIPCVRGVCLVVLGKFCVPTTLTGARFCGWRWHGKKSKKINCMESVEVSAEFS